ncbi:MAG: fused MFS/spermidine synthase [Nitrospiraceae bacterium]
MMLPITAFLSGAIVMAMEILGSRLLAPVFGNSLFVWGALIGVILAAMSSGYAFGGWASDRFPGHRVLAGLFVGSGLWTVALAGISQTVLTSVASWIDDPRWGPCVAGTILLAPPAFGLSGILPALLRLAVHDMGHLGRSTGRMIAVSTVGSLVGTWGTAFFLLSWVGTRWLLIGLGLAQLALGLVWMLGRGAFLRTATTATLAGLVGVGWLAAHPLSPMAMPVYQEESPYQQLRVRDDDLFRYLILDRTFHAVMWKTDPVQLYLPYSQAMMLAFTFVPEPSRALILGHGGGSLAKWLGATYPKMELDTVEVDPSVARVAEEYFGYTPAPTHHVYVKDARAFLQARQTQYDIIWMDAFARHMIPFHLTTREFYAELRRRLSPGGVLAVNLASSGEGGDLARERAVVETLRTTFPTVETLSVQGPWKSKQGRARNLIFFAGAPVDGQGVATAQMRTPQMIADRKLPIEALELWATRRTEPWSSGAVLTDDFAPYDLLMGRDVEAPALDGPTR